MKQFITIITLPMLCIGIQAQEKLFQEGLRSGRASQKFYYAKNTKGKGVSLEKMKQYAVKQNYLLGDYTTKQIDRFGDKQTAIDGIYFLPKDEYPKYVFEHVFPNLSYDGLKQRGTCWIYAHKKFDKWENVYWSGNIEDGKLDGEGYAFFIHDNGRYFLAIKGTFQHGLPLFRIDVKCFNVGTDPSKVSFVPVSNVNVDRVSDGMAGYSENGGKSGFVTSDGIIAIEPKYEYVIKGFNDGKAEVKLDGKEIIIDKNGKYVDLTANQKRLDDEQRQAELKRQQEELRRQEEENERKRIAAAQEAERRAADIERKKNCEGRQIVWTETATYDFGEGGLTQGFLDLLGGSALHQVEYVVQYTAIVEKVIANESVKCIIQRFAIQDPKFASVNYLKYRKYAVNDFSENVGKTRVLDMSEFELK